MSECSWIIKTVVICCFSNTDLLRNITQAHLDMALLEEVVVSVVITNSSPVSKQINKKREECRQHGFSNCGMRTTTGKRP